MGRGTNDYPGYEAARLARERYAEYVASHYEMHMAGLRFFAVYHGYGGAGEHEGEYANVIAQFADDIANGTQPTLYGDGEQTRDFTHVSDIARGMELTGRDKRTGVYNLGTGENDSFKRKPRRIPRPTVGGEEADTRGGMYIF